MPTVLVAVATLAAVAALPGCTCNVRTSDDGASVGAGAPTTSSTGFGVMAVGGSEVWNIDGQSLRIPATYFVVNNGRLQFTADYLCAERCPDVGSVSDDRAFQIAYPVMKYSVSKKLYERSTVQRAGGTPLQTELIGVAITQQAPGGKEKGYRVARTLEQVQAAMKEEGAGGTPK